MLTLFPALFAPSAKAYARASELLPLRRLVEIINIFFIPNFSLLFENYVIRYVYYEYRRCVYFFFVIHYITKIFKCPILIFNIRLCLELIIK